MLESLDAESYLAESIDAIECLDLSTEELDRHWLRLHQILSFSPASETLMEVYESFDSERMEIRPELDLQKLEFSRAVTLCFLIDYRCLSENDPRKAEWSFGRELLHELLEPEWRRIELSLDPVLSVSHLKFIFGEYFDWNHVYSQFRFDANSRDIEQMDLMIRRLHQSRWVTPEQFLNFADDFSCRGSSRNPKAVQKTIRRVGLSFESIAGRLSSDPQDYLNREYLVVRPEFRLGLLDGSNGLDAQFFHDHSLFCPDVMFFAAQDRESHELLLKRTSDLIVEICSGGVFENHNNCSEHCMASNNFLDYIDNGVTCCLQSQARCNIARFKERFYSEERNSIASQISESRFDEHYLFDYLDEYVSVLLRSRDPKVGEKIVWLFSTLKQTESAKYSEHLLMTQSVRVWSRVLTPVYADTPKVKRLKTIEQRLNEFGDAVVSTIEKNSSTKLSPMSLLALTNLKLGKNPEFSVPKQTWEVFERKRNFVRELIYDHSVFDDCRDVVDHLITQRPIELTQSYIWLANNKGVMNFQQTANAYIVTQLSRRLVELDRPKLRHELFKANHRLGGLTLLSAVSASEDRQKRESVFRSYWKYLAKEDQHPFTDVQVALAKSVLFESVAELVKIKDEDPEHFDQQLKYILDEFCSKGEANSVDVKTCQRIIRVVLSLFVSKPRPVAIDHELFRIICASSVAEASLPEISDVVANVYFNPFYWEEALPVSQLIVSGRLSLASLRTACKSDAHILKFCRLCHQLGPIALSEKEFLLKQLNHKRDRVVIAAILALSRVDWPANFMLKRLTEIINDKSRSGYVRGAAICAMRRFEGNPKVGVRLRELMNSKSLEPLLRDTAKRSLPVWEYHQKPVPTLLDWPADH